MILGCYLLGQHYIVGYRYSWMHDLNIRCGHFKIRGYMLFSSIKVITRYLHVGSDIRTFIWILLILKT